jgi:bisphosphoglycerate-dependent phosphoglycerate mutase
MLFLSGLSLPIACCVLPASPDTHALTQMSEGATLRAVMVKTRKIQVTLEEEEYEHLAQKGRRERKKLAAIVRESIRKYSILPEAERAKRTALEVLFSLPPTPVPKSYHQWKREYGALKSKNKKSKS